MNEKKDILLSEMKPGTSGKIVRIEGGQGIHSKLDGMGMRIGSRIIKISQQALRGPVVVQAGRTKIAIGYGMAKKIAVEL